MKTRWAKLLAAAFGLMWLTLFVCLYYIYHKPFDAELATKWLGHAAELVVSSAILAVAGGIGNRIIPSISHRPLFSMAWQAAAGLGVLGSGYFIVGALLGVSWLTSGGVLLGVTVLFWKRCLSWCKLALDGLVDLHPRSRLGTAASLGVAIVIACGLLTAFAPAVKFDALVYHLALPRQYLAAGRVIYDPMNWFWGMPQLGEMLFTLAMALAGERAAAVLGWAVACLALASLWELNAHYFGPQPAWMALGSLLAGSTLASSLGTGYVDWLVILYGICALGSLADWHRAHEPGFLGLAGAAAGLAVGTKYTAGVLVVGGMALIIWRHLRTRSGIRQVLISFLWFSIPAVLMIIPWLVKNWVASGNPMHPFIFPADELQQFRQEFYRLQAWGKGFMVLFLPFWSSIEGIEGTPGFSASIGPLLAGLAPIGCLSVWKGKSKYRPVIETAAIFCLATWIIWAVGSRLAGLLIQTRLYFACFPAAAVLAGAGFRALLDLRLPRIRIGRVAGVLVLLVFSLSVYQAFELLLRQGVDQVVFAGQSENEFEERNLGWYAPAIHAVSKLSPNTQILMLWEPRGLSCIPACTPDYILDRWITSSRRWTEPGRIREAWRQLGYTHLLYNGFGAEYTRKEDLRYSSADWEVLQELLGQLKIASQYGEAYTLFELQP